MTTVTMSHIRKAGMCSKGARKFMESNIPGFDWLDFLKNGVEAERLAATGDSMALRVVEVAHGK